MPLRSKIEFYIPFPNGVDKPEDNEKWVQMVVVKFRRWFQNAAIRKERMYADCIIGNSTTGVVCVVWSFCTTNQLQQHFPSVDALVHEVAEHMGCADVFVTVNGSMYIIFAR